MTLSVPVQIHRTYVVLKMYTFLTLFSAACKTVRKLQGGAFPPPLPKYAITLSILLLSSPYFSTLFLHLFYMFQAIKTFNWCIFVCIGSHWLKKEISPKSQFCWNLYKSYFKSSVFYKTDNFDATDKTKNVLESQDLVSAAAAVVLFPCIHGR